MPAGTCGRAGSRPCCSASAVRRSRSYSRALSMQTAAREASSAASVTSAGPNAWLVGARPNIAQPTTVPRAMSGMARNAL